MVRMQRVMHRLALGHERPVLEQLYEQHTGDESADVGPDGNAPRRFRPER
jgi:hypothetical protein